MACFDQNCLRGDCNPNNHLTVEIVEEAVDRHGYRNYPFIYVRHMEVLRDDRNEREIYMIESRGGVATRDYAGMFPLSFSVCIFALYT